MHRYDCSEGIVTPDDATCPVCDGGGLVIEERGGA